MTKSLPLPPRFFKCPELTEREQHYLIGKAKESAKALVDATRNNEGPVRWEEAGMHRGVQMYKGEARYPESVVGEAITYGCGATTIQSTLEEVADFFDLSTDEKVAEFITSSSEVLDCQLLYVLDDSSLLNDPRYNTRTHHKGASQMLNANQVTVKWFAMDVPSKLMKNRDFLTVECQSTFRDVSGRRGWVRSYHSIKLPCCPELSNYSLVRGSFYHTGYVFVESERPGFLDVIFSAQVNLKGSIKVPTALFMTIQKKRLSSVADLQRLITRRRLGSQRFLGDLEIVPKSQRSRCNLCSTKFGLITRKARCRKCGEVVCASACSMEWEVSIPGQGVRKIRVCSKCAQDTDPSVFENYASSEHYSDNSVHEDDTPIMSIRAPGYQYNKRSDTGSSPRLHDQRSIESDECDNRGDYRGPQGSFSNSYEDVFSQNDNPLDHKPDFHRTVEMPGDHVSISPNSDRYLDDSGEYDDRRRRDDKRYDPRNPDMYDHQSLGVSPPQYRDDEQKRALQRQQRVLQQRQNKQRLFQRQQQQQESLMRRRQEQYQDSDNFDAELKDSLSNSDLSDSNLSGDSVGAQPSFLTSSLLAQHTKQMGKPGPVTRNERDAVPRVAQPQQRVKRRKPKAEPKRRAPPPSLSTDRPLTRLEQMQVQRWAEQEAKFREQVALEESFDLELECADITPSFISRRHSGGSEDSAMRCGPELPPFFRSLNNGTPAQDRGSPTGESVLPFESKTQVSKSGQRTVSVVDDEDRLGSAINGLAINFNSLLRPEDLRSTEDSMCLSLDSSGLDLSALSDMNAANLGKTGGSAAKGRIDASKTNVVMLYQQILELTKRQHELEAQPESDPDEKKKVAHELETLYRQLHSEVEI